jgi:hypothetical protein
MRRQLESLAQQLLVRFASLEPFRPPKDPVLRRAAAEAAREDREAERITNFKRLCAQYCAAFLRYHGNQLEEYLYLALQREMERLKSGPLRSNREINSRIKSAIDLAYVQIAANLRTYAEMGQFYGSISEGTFTVRYTMPTVDGRQEVFLTAQMVDGRRDHSIVLSLSPSAQFHATHARHERPAYCNCPPGLRQ